MIKSITKPENATVQPENTTAAPKKAVEEVFKAMAMQPIQDWSSNDGIPFIAQVNPYAAAGMGFANQMANPFKQKYFENKAKANSEEEARRLNYEYARQKEQDDIQKGLFDLQKKQYERDEQQRKLDSMVFIEPEDVNIPAMSNYEDYMPPEDAAQARAAESILNEVKEFDTSTVEGMREYSAYNLRRKQAKSVLNALNLKHFGIGDKIPTRKINNPARDLTEEAYSKGLAGFKARQDALSEGERDVNDMQNILDDGVMLGKFGVSLLKRSSFGKQANDKARVIGHMNKLHKQYENTGYQGHVISRENLQFNPTSNPQITARQMQIKRLLDANQAYVVQMVSPHKTNIVTYLVTPSGKQDISNAFVTTTQMANQDAATNRAADIRGALGG